MIVVCCASKSVVVIPGDLGVRLTMPGAGIVGGVVVAFISQGAPTLTTLPFGKTVTISPSGPTAVIGSFSVVEVVVVGGWVVVVGQAVS